MRRSFSHVVLAVLAVGVTYAVGQVRAPQPSRPAAAPELNDLTPDEAVNVRVYQSANRGVVNVMTRSAPEEDFLSAGGPREGSGSGVVLDKRGHVLTNFHVVEDARQTVATLSDGSVHEAKLIGADPSNDLAVLKIDAPAEKLFPLPWGDSSRLLVGLRVFALGNPFGLERTLTTGIIGSLNRSLRTENQRKIRGVIQTDAAINPGNSGGPLLNKRGEMIGITTALVSRSGQSSGLGLAIPANTARRVVDELIRFGRVIRPDSGVAVVYETEKGLLVARLTPDGPAERAGLRGPQRVTIRRGGATLFGVDRSKADLIVAVDGRAVKSVDDLLTEVERKKPGEKVIFTVIREGATTDVAVELEPSKG